MKYIDSFELFGLFEYHSQTQTKVFAKVCERYVKDTDIWKRMKDKIMSDEPELVLRRYESYRGGTEAQFEMPESTKDKVVISMLTHYRGGEASHSGTLAHELVHALQFLENGGKPFDQFISISTREFEKFSRSEAWRDFMLALYLIDPIEVEAWNAECKWEIPYTFKNMSGWMNRFNPVEFAEKLRSLKPLPNKNNMTSFDQFPFVWVDSYKHWNQEEPGKMDPELLKLGNFRKNVLVRFLEYYDKKFKTYKGQVLNK